VPAGRIRVLALYAGLLLVAATTTDKPPLTLGPGRLGWLPAALTLAAAACCAAVPAAVSYLLSLALISQGLYGFVIARMYAWNGTPVTRYALMPVGEYSRLTYLVLPAAYALLGLGGWLLWAAIGERPELARPVLGARLAAARAGTAPRRELWGLLLLPVTAMTADLFASGIWFGRGPASAAWTAVIGASALIIVRLRPVIAADLAGLERRLAAFDGVVAVSSPPGGPTIVALELACALS
jgi:hypothetical protein